MPNNDGSGNQRRNALSGASILVGAVGVAVGVLAAEHAQAQEENRDSVIDNMTRWIRNHVIDLSPSTAGERDAHSPAASSHAPPATATWDAQTGFAQRADAPLAYPQGMPVPVPLRRALTRAEVNVLPVRRVADAHADPDAHATTADVVQQLPYDDGEDAVDGIADVAGGGVATVTMVTMVEPHGHHDGHDALQAGLRQRRKSALPHNEEKAFCVVCRESYVGGDQLMRLPCFHEFHAECIREYLETTEGPVCPICRHPVTVS